MNKNIRSKYRRVMYTMASLLVLLLTLVYFVKLDNMSEISIFHLAFNILGIIESLVVYNGLVTAAIYTNKKNVTYTRFVVCNAFCCFISGCLWALNGWAHLIVFKNILYFAQYAISFIGTLFFFGFLSTTIGVKANSVDEKALKKVLPNLRYLNIVYVIMFGALIISMIYGLVYYIDDAGIYHKSYLDFLPSAFNLLLSLLCVLLSRSVPFYSLFRKTLIPFVLVNAITCTWTIVSPYYEPLSPMLSACTVIAYCYSYLEMEAYNRTLNRKFGRYVSNAEAKNAVMGKDTIKVGGDKLKVSVLMCQLREFNLVSKLMNVEDMAELFNHYLSEMTHIIEKHHGTVLGFPGYGVMAVFGAPIPFDGYIKEAVDAAMEMQKAMESINLWNEAHHYPILSMGCGVSTGDSIVGNIGSDRHMRYSTISRIVNLCSRIESYAKEGQILITDETRIGYGESLAVEQKKEVFMKGFTDSIIYYAIVR